MDLFDKHGGYRKLDSFTLACVIQLGTWRFCETFLNRRNDPSGRQFDQMTQAARSGRQNIVEGSERAGTSKGTEMTLTDVARASLAELKGDFEFWLIRRGIAPWKIPSPEAQAVFDVRLDKKPLQEGGFRERMMTVRLEEREKQNADPSAPDCPQCGKPMRKRTAKSGKKAGQAFWGCTGYPECTGTREVEA